MQVLQNLPPPQCILNLSLYIMQISQTLNYQYRRYLSHAVTSMFSIIPSSAQELHRQNIPHFREDVPYIPMQSIYLTHVKSVISSRLWGCEVLSPTEYC